MKIMENIANKTPTAHIEAKLGDFAKTVLMPGDPLRAKYIAEKFLENPKQITGVRGMLGYTGTYQGKPVSVMGSGMGIPSISIYAYELFSYYGVENIIRAGSTGSLQDNIQVHDIIIGMGASTDSNVNRQRFMGQDFAAIADYQLLETAVNKARELEMQVHIGNIVSADLFYDPRGLELFRKYQAMNILGVEMEAAGLYGVAAELHKKALCILTVSDHIFSGAALSSKDRQNSFDQMAQLSLATAISID